MSSSADSTPAAAHPQPDLQPIHLTIHHRGHPHTLAFPAAATLTDLSASLASTLSIPAPNQKLLIAPKPGLLRPPFPDPHLALSTLTARKITLLGSTPSEVSALSSAVSTARAPPRLTTPSATPARTTRAGVSSTYTFAALLPLAHLPRPERSLALLTRLRDDAGVRFTMAKHAWRVGLLTEMDPALHTTHASRTLGLNRNAGEVIELRLRTDAYDGYRDYATIRRTLCHELAHNVWGEHDGRFWKLCKEVEREVEAGDWRSGGRRLTEEEFYTPRQGEAEGEVDDHGGWSGGEFVLGSGEGGSAGGSGGVVVRDGGARREAAARAAEERAERTRKEKEGKTGE